IEQYPFLAPPTIRVTATYPGASAVAVEQSVATPIEQEVNGVESMIYMQSSNTSDGRMLLDVNFAVGVDQDKANVLTQNRVNSAEARLPAEVTAQGVTVKKQSPSILMVISLYSPKGTYDANYLINYCGINLRDQILRIPGIAQVDLFGGTDYGMRIWLRPDKLAKLGLTPAEVIYEAMKHAKGLFPPDMDYKIVYDTTPSVEASIHEIVKTFIEALILVTLVVFIFLQNVRATFVPLLTVPVSLIGTFIFFPL